MPKGTNQKLKLSYLIRIMLEKTDEEHSLNMSQIMSELEKYDITAERKSIYADFQDMTDRLGIEVLKEQIGRETYYHVADRDFELAEVKLLIDAVQSSKFITESKSRELITKVKGLVSEHQAKQLQRQVFINDRVKTMNESVYYNVDDIHNAINNNKKIKFKYCKWNISKQLAPKRDGQWYTISPWALMWDDENYYLVAYDDEEDMIKHYRVDKMMKLSVIDEKRGGAELFKNFDMAAYSKMSFGMYGGRKTKVHIEFPDDMCGIFIDRFGKDISFRPVGGGRSVIAVDVAVSYQFMGWIFSLGPDVRITSPTEVVEKMREAIENFSKNY